MHNWVSADIIDHLGYYLVHVSTHLHSFWQRCRRHKNTPPRACRIFSIALMFAGESERTVGWMFTSLQLDLKAEGSPFPKQMTRRPAAPSHYQVLGSKMSLSTWARRWGGGAFTILSHPRCSNNLDSTLNLSPHRVMHRFVTINTPRLINMDNQSFVSEHPYIFWILFSACCI